MIKDSKLVSFEAKALNMYEARAAEILGDFFKLEVVDLRNNFTNESDLFVQEVKSIPTSSLDVYSHSLVETETKFNNYYSKKIRKIGSETHLEIVKLLNEYFISLAPEFYEFSNPLSPKIFTDKNMLNRSFLHSLDLQVDVLNKNEAFLHVNSLIWNSIYVDASSKSKPKQLSLGFTVEMTHSKKNLLRLHLQHYSFLSGFLSTRDLSVSRNEFENTAIEHVSFCLSVFYFKKFIRDINHNPS